MLRLDLKYFGLILVSWSLTVGSPIFAMATVATSVPMGVLCRDQINDIESVGQVHAQRLPVDSVVLSKNIHDLPYPSAIREPLTLDANDLYEMTKQIPEILDLTITTAIIGSPEKAADNGVVRWGYLPDGRPVAVKTIMRLGVSAEALIEETKGAMILSAVGVFPKFHGIWHGDGHYSIVTDIFAGDVYIRPTRVTLKVLRQFHEIIRRLGSIGVNRLPDEEIFFQVMRSSHDDFNIIDAAGFYREFINGNPSIAMAEKTPILESFEDYQMYRLFREQEQAKARKIKTPYLWGAQMSDLILTAKAADAIQILREIREKDSVLWPTLLVKLESIIYRWNEPVDESVKHFLFGLN